MLNHLEMDLVELEYRPVYYNTIISQMNYNGEQLNINIYNIIIHHVYNIMSYYNR